MKFNLFPFTSSTSDKPLKSFDNILGAFLRAIYSLNSPEKMDREAIINSICNDVSFDDNSANKLAFCKAIKDMYFVDENNLKCTSIDTYKYTLSTKNDYKISEYIVSALCDRDKVKEALSNRISSAGNILDTLVESHLPELTAKKRC